MTIELQILGFAALLWVLQFCVAAVAVNRQLGSDYLMGPRDEPRQLGRTQGRLKRALDNYSEGLPLFAIACLLVALGDASSGLTVACAGVFLAARVLYVPAYVLGWNPWRSLIWAVGFFATVILLVAALVG